MKNSMKKTVAIIIAMLIIGFTAFVIKNYQNNLKKREFQQNEKLNKDKNSLKNDSEIKVQGEEKVNQIIDKDNQSKSLDSSAINEVSKSKILQIRPDDFIVGDKNAKITIIEYASLSCPHCANFHSEAFDKLKTEYIDSGKAVFIHRDFILNQPSLIASMFAICQAEDNAGNAVEKYYSTLKALFKTQSSWAFDPKFIDKLKSIAQLDSMTPERFTACVNNGKLQEKILNNFIEARKALKLESAPTFFINGEVLQGYVDYLTIKKIIDRQLAEPKK